MSKHYSHCQSCYTPLTGLNRATEEDLTKSIKYCNKCYNLWKFTEPEITLDEMVYKVDHELSRFFIPKFLRNKFTNHIAWLERWIWFKSEE